MNLARRRIAVLAAIAVAASILAFTPSAAAQAAAQHADGFQASIDRLEWYGYNGEFNLFAGTGCADSDELCPEEPVLRWEIAVWLVRITDRTTEQPAIRSSRYDDVDPSAWWAPHAERLADLGIDLSCGTDPLRLCPHEPMDRGQMAEVLARFLDLPRAGTAAFVDVSADHPHIDDIDRLAGARITGGCGVNPARYCPDQHVTRGQMAAFLARALAIVDLAEPVPAQDPTPLPVDPEAMIGTLDNGLTYYLRHNDDPGKNLAVQLLINVGSVDETDEQVGIGHFIEHMLFNGTADYPGNSLGEALREIGVELGPDINASVGHDRTVYEIEVRLDEPHKAPLVFHALSQMAAEATFADDAVESERGVVLDEMRFRRESVGGVISAEFDRVYTQGTPYEGRDPIGTLDSVNSMTAEDLRAFYEKWYVPANMAVVAVGDMAVEDIRTLVEEHFGPLPSGDGREPPGVYIPPAESSSHVVTDPRYGVTLISLDIPIDPHDPGTLGGDRLATMESLIEVMITNRVSDAYHRGELSQVDPPHFSSFTYTRGLRYYGTNWQGGDLDTASSDYLSVLLTAQEHGFTDGDRGRAVQQIASSLQFQLDSAPTTQDNQWAGLYQQHYFYGADIDSVAGSVARTATLLTEITTEELTEHFRRQMARGGLLAIAVGPDPSSVPTADELDAALAGAAPGPPPAEAVAIEQLMTAPEPADAVSEGSFDLLEDGYEWEFANGARVMFAPSDIAEGQVNLQAQSLGGWSVLEPGDRALSAIAINAVRGSGLGDLSRLELNRFLEDRTVEVNAFIGEIVEGFTGSAGTDDVETMFQLIHLLATEPRVDEQAYADAVHTAETRLELAGRDPRWQAGIAYLEARYGTTWHRAVASRAEIDSLTRQRLLDMYRSRLGSVDDLVVAVVGDIDASEVERLARRYIGTLPAGEADTYVDRRRPMPSGLVQRQVKVGEGESAVLEIYHEADIELTPLRAVAADVLETALAERLFLVIREELGASYVAGGTAQGNAAPRQYFGSRVYATLDPSRFDEIYATMLQILSDVAANGLTPAEFEQAVAIRTTDYARSGNFDLLGALLSRPHVGDENVLTQQRRTEELGRLTPEDVQALAAALYGEGGRIEIARRP
ncbi:MAG: insulinase family protein [Acidimicrobiaceae bacterium]|nr:insulinase family protein [Acidimicrobiaceae bacterium]